MTRAREVTRLAFPACPLTQRFVFSVLFEDGRVVTLWAEDSVEALATAQQRGAVRHLCSRGRP